MLGLACKNRSCKRPQEELYYTPAAQANHLQPDNVRKKQGYAGQTRTLTVRKTYAKCGQKMSNLGLTIFAGCCKILESLGLQGLQVPGVWGLVFCKIRYLRKTVHISSICIPHVLASVAVNSPEQYYS